MADGGAPRAVAFDRLPPAPDGGRPLAPPRPRRADPNAGRSLWWRVHHWAGLKLSIFLTFVMLTGTLAVFAHEIDWLLTPAMRVAPQDRPHASWGAQAAAVQAAVPGGEISMMSAPIDPWFATAATVETEEDRLVFVYVNPWTAEAQGVASWWNAHRVLRFLHRHLMMPVKWGLPIVCSTAFLLLASLVTGLVAYKKWWRGFGRVPRLRKGRPGEARRFTGDLHRLAGVWSLWFVALMIVTGLWYLIEWGGGAAPPHPRPPETIAGAEVPVGPALDRLVATAQAAYPELEITGVRFDDRGVVFEGRDGTLLVRDRSNAVWTHPETGAVLLKAEGARLNWRQRIGEAADPLHFGTWGGLASKLVWFLFGAALTGLCVTGVMIYALRLKRADAQRRGSVGRALAGMGVWAYVALALVVVGLVLTPFAIATV
jgi:uncharacterized iron-regulated membrane protein